MHAKLMKNLDIRDFRLLLFDEMCKIRVAEAKFTVVLVPFIKIMCNFVRYYASAKA